MKKLVSIVIIILILSTATIGVGYFYLMESSKPVIRDQLSERSREFLSEQMKKSDSDLRTVDLENKRPGESDFDSNRVTIKNCYSLVVPFAVSDDRQNDPCVYYAILESPRGSMTSNLREVGFSSVEGAPDVTFRRGKKEQYKEESFVSNGRQFLVFSNIQTNSEKTAFGMVESGETNQIFTVSLNTGGDDAQKMRQLKKIVDSVELK